MEEAVSSAIGVAIPVLTEVAGRGRKVSIAGWETKVSGLVGVGAGVASAIALGAKRMGVRIPIRDGTLLAFTGSSLATGIAYIVLYELKKRKAYELGSATAEVEGLQEEIKPEEEVELVEEV